MLRQYPECDCDLSKGLELRWDNIDFTCPKTWAMIQDGNTVGCFQIESSLGRRTCKDVQPFNLKELADVITLMRPSCQNGYLEDGKNIAHHYVQRKFGLEEGACIVPQLDDILRDTHFLMLYQEQAIFIGTELAGMTHALSDKLLRKAIGKKRSDLIAEAKKIFIDGCINHSKLEQSEAELIFSWIESSQRYSFNKSHAVEYAYITYKTAWAKAHFPLQFYRSYLSHSKNKQKPLEEIDRLITDAKKNGVVVRGPDIRLRNRDFDINKEEQLIHYGISNIKSIGDKASDEILDIYQAGDEQLTWTELLFTRLLRVKKKSAVKILMACGAFDYLEIFRKKMLYEHENCTNLKEKEIQYIVEHCDLINSSVSQCLEALLELPAGRGQIFANRRRQQTIQGILTAINNPFTENNDSIEQLCSWEESYLGYSINQSIFDVVKRYGGEARVDDVDDGSFKKYTITGQIKRPKEFINASGELMAFFIVADDTGQIDDAVIFPDKYQKYGHLIKHLKLVQIYGMSSKRGFVVDLIREK